MSSERDERKWTQYVSAHGQKSEHVNPRPLPPKSQTAVEAEREVTNYLVQLDAAEKWMRGRFQQGECDTCDSVVIEMSNWAAIFEAGVAEYVDDEEPFPSD